MNRTLNLKKEGLENHLLLLETLSTRNEAWMFGINDSQVLRTHREILDLLTQISSKYNQLLSLYSKDES